MVLIESFTLNKLGAELKSDRIKKCMFFLSPGAARGLANTDCLHGSVHPASTTFDHNNYQMEIARAQKHNALYCYVISVSRR